MYDEHDDLTIDDEPKEPTTPLEAALGNLAACRVEEDHERDELAHFDDDWNAARKPFLERLEAAKKRSAEADANVRTLALEAYHASQGQNKRPCKGVEIKSVRKVTDYSVAAATEWAKANAPFALTVDKKRFERLVSDGDVPADVASVKEVAQTYIASDLSKWL